MRRYSLTVLICLCIPVVLYGQKDRGVSKPGRIKNPIIKKQAVLKSSDIQCEISYSDPSGDNILGVGETGTLTVSVKNNGKAAISAPKLVISYHTSWNPSPKDTIKWIEPIQPGGTGQHKIIMKWAKNSPSGTVTYSAKLVETKTNIVSESSEFTFYITDVGKDKTEPVFLYDLEIANGFGLMGTPKMAITQLARLLSEIPVSERAEATIMYTVSSK